MTEQFHHEVNGKTVTLPHLKNLPFGVIRKLRNEDPAEQLFSLVEQTADEDALEVIDTLGMEQVNELFTAWQEASGVSLGESTASSTS